MTAIYMDGFDHYGTGAEGNANMLEGSWATDGGVGPGVPAWGAATGALSLQGGTGGYRHVLPATKAEVFQSFRYSVSSLPSNNANQLICDFRDNTNAVIAALWCQSTGAIALLDTSGNTLAATQGPIIVPRNWHFFEMEFNQGTGVFILRVDDPTAANTPIIDATGLSLGSNPVAQQLYINEFGGANPSWLDDLFIRDGSGSVNNGFLGDRRVSTLLVDDDTPTAGWSANRYTKLGAGILNVTSANASVGVGTATSLDIGNTDFTIEAFIRFQTLPSGSNKSVIFSRWDQPNDQRSYELFLGSQSLNGGCLCWQTSTDGTSSTITQSIIYPWVPDLETWYNIAIVRASGELLLFVNGQQFGLPIADTSTYFAGSSPFGLAAEMQSNAGGTVANTSLDGWMDEVRFTNGFARYTANFTPTTVEFPRNVGGDPEFADVVLLAGFDTIIQDESSFARLMQGNNGAVQQTPNDGPSIGTWPVIGKSVPDDNTFIEAPFVAATGVLTLTANPSNTNTVTVGTKDGSVAAVYTFKTTLASAFDVLIDTSIANTLQNLYNAINAGPGAGTKYGTATTANFDVNALQLPAGQMEVVANIPGTAGNSIASTSSGITGSWGASTLAGGLDIPGPSNFKVQRLAPTTTIVSAIQVSMRSFKSDAGIGSINSALVGALGGIATGATHSLTVSPVYYNDVYETDPDTSGPISPTTLTNGAIQVNRDT